MGRKKKEEKKKLTSSEIARNAALKAHSTSLKGRMSEISKKAWATRKKNLHEAYKSGKKKSLKKGKK